MPIKRNTHVLKTHLQRLDVSIIVLIVLDDAPSPMDPREYVHIYLIFVETRTIGLHFAAYSIGLYSFTFFSGGLRKTSY